MDLNHNLSHMSSDTDHNPKKKYRVDASPITKNSPLTGHDINFSDVDCSTIPNRTPPRRLINDDDDEEEGDHFVGNHHGIHHNQHGIQHSGMEDDSMQQQYDGDDSMDDTTMFPYDNGGSLSPPVVSSLSPTSCPDSQDAVPSPNTRYRARLSKGRPRRATSFAFGDVSTLFFFLFFFPSSLLSFFWLGESLTS